MLIGLLVILFTVCAVLIVTVATLFIILMAIGFFGIFGYQLYSIKKTLNMVENFNEGLFNKRGVRVSYYCTTIQE